MQAHQTAIAQAELESIRRAESVDVTLPGRPQNLGKLHITTRALRDIYAIFTAMGFQIYDSPEVETDEYNFQLLNIPPGHPARDMWETFILPLLACSFEHIPALDRFTLCANMRQNLFASFSLANAIATRQLMPLTNTVLSSRRTGGWQTYHLQRPQGSVDQFRQSNVWRGTKGALSQKLLPVH